MSGADYPAFYRLCAVFRHRLLADPAPLSEGERAALVEVLNAFEALMAGARELAERIGDLDDLLKPPGA